MTLADPAYAPASGGGLHRPPASAQDASARGRLPVPVLIYLILVVTPVGFNLGSLYMTGLRVYLLIMIVPLVLRLLSGKCGRVLPVDVLFMLHMVWAYVALQVNNPSMAITQFGSLGAEMLGGYLMARVYIRSKADFIALCRWLGALVCLTLPFAILETRTGNPIIISTIESIPGLRSVSNVNNPPRLGLERAQVMMGHPIHYGYLCSTAFALVFMGLKGVLPTPQRLAMSAGVVLAVFLSLSSGALLPVIMMAFMILWWNVLHRTGIAWMLLLVLAALAYVTVDLLSTRTPIQVFFSYATFSAHNAYWRGLIFDWGMVNVWANPVFGIGLNDWVRPHFMNSGSMDNFWLVMAVRYGIPGFLLVAAGYAVGVWAIARARLDWDPVVAQLRRAWMLTFVGLAFTLCTVHVWTNIYSYTFFLYGAGIWFIFARPDTPAPDGAQTAQPAPAPQGRAAPAYSRFPSRPTRS